MNPNQEETNAMVEAWVKKNKPKRYTHGERPEGMPIPTISSWGKPRRRGKAETQAMKDAGEL